MVEANEKSEAGFDSNKEEKSHQATCEQWFLTRHNKFSQPNWHAQR